MSIHAIVMDIDGTLTNDKKEISKETKEALMQAQKQGVKVVLASGRTTRGVSSYAQELELEKYGGAAIVYNGAKLVDWKSKDVLYEKSMSIQQSKAILHHMKQFDRARAIIDKDDYEYVENVYDCMVEYNGTINIYEYEARGGQFKLCEVDDLEEWVDFPVPKMLFTANPDYLQEHYQEMERPFKEELNGMFTAPFYFEFTAKNVDKGNALQAYCQAMGFDIKDVISFGDAQNDISMVKQAGIGIAMKNACEQLKEVADDITLTNNEDGIAYSLKKYEVIK